MSHKLDREALAKAVHDVVRSIPRGRATSYGAIARAVGYPNLFRLIGRIMAECSTEKVNIPAHRVVNNQGVLSAAAIFKDMQQLLENEGIIVINNRIKNWKLIFWNPIDEIKI